MTSRCKASLRIALVLLTLTALVILSGCAQRNHNGVSNQPGQQTTSQQNDGTQTSAGQNGGSNSAAQQVDNADQQIQDALQGMDNAQNDANSADDQSNPSTVVP